MDELLVIRDLSVRFYTYEGLVHALENVNLEIKRSETFGLVGETGSGKTLTALSILRLVPPPGKIESGSIYFYADDMGQPVDLLNISEDDIRVIRGKKISMVFQEPGAALDPVYTIGDQISEVNILHQREELVYRALAEVNIRLNNPDSVPSRLLALVRLIEKGLYCIELKNPHSPWLRTIERIPLLRKLLQQIRIEADKMAVSLLKEVEIPDPEMLVRQYPHQLSGGMKQRAVIAMALACSPRFLIADEPTTALDVTIQAQILNLLCRLKTELESSILYITHDLGVAAEICDRIGVMYAGSICEQARVENLYADPLHPYTRALMAAVPRPGREPRSIGGIPPDLIHPPSGCRFHPRCDNAKAVCQQITPQLTEAAPEHYVACHLW